MLKYAYSLNIVHNLTFKKKEICWWVCCVNFGNCIMDTQESCLDSVKNKMLGNEVEEWIAFDIYIYISITFLQQIINDRLLLVGKKVILMIDSIMIS